METSLTIDVGILQFIRKIRSMAYGVFNELGRGYSESVYQRALCVELQIARVEYDIEIPIVIPYKGHSVGQVRADIIVRSACPIILETKINRFFRDEERCQLTRYMKLLKIDVGILINFGERVQTQVIVGCDNEYYVYNMKTGVGTII
jgi:GxxExxY protein